MCYICLKTPCDPRCPNAPDPTPVLLCSGCSQNIYDGEDYWDFGDEQLCEVCIDKRKRTAIYDPY